MNNDKFHIWKIKHQLATEGSYQAIQQIKQSLLTSDHDPFNLASLDFYQLLQNSTIHQVFAGDVHGPYETYKQTPLFLVIGGKIQLRFINLEADTQTLMEVQGNGAIGVEASKLQEKYGKENLNLLTKFELVASTDGIIIQTSGTNQKKIMKPALSQKQLNLMKKLMIFPTKDAIKLKVNAATLLKDRMYLLSGKACYFLDQPQNKIILACYTEGYFNPKQFSQNSNIKLYVFEDSQVMFLQEDFLKDQYVKALQCKRCTHLEEIKKKYKQMNGQQIGRIQQKLIIKYRLPQKVVDAQIYQKKLKVRQSSTNKNDKKLKSKTDLISTSSSIKCAIRIRKSKKIN